jgi:hypothetical protein
MYRRLMGTFSVAVFILTQAMSAAYAGPKSQHNSSVKAQCISDAQSKGLTGQAAKAAIKQCTQNGMFTH